MKLYVACKETGEFIDEVKNIEEGIELIERFEAMDEQDGNYSPNFYDIVDDGHCSVEF